MNADSRVSCCSYQTRIFTPYFLVNPAAKSSAADRRSEPCVRHSPSKLPEWTCPSRSRRASRLPLLPPQPPSHEGTRALVSGAKKKAPGRGDKFETIRLKRASTSCMRQAGRPERSGCCATAGSRSARGRRAGGRTLASRASCAWSPCRTVTPWGCGRAAR